MSEKELKRLMIIAISDYETARKNKFMDSMVYNTGKITAYNQIASLMMFKFRVEYFRKLGKYKISE